MYLHLGPVELSIAEITALLKGLLKSPEMSLGDDLVEQF